MNDQNVHTEEISDAARFMPPHAPLDMPQQVLESENGARGMIAAMFGVFAPRLRA